MTTDSLGEKNTPGRRRGARLSRAQSVFFKKLQKLDREITKLDRFISFSVDGTEYKRKLVKKREKLDLKRKEVREKRKNARTTP